MTYIANTLGNLIQQTAFFNLTWGNYLMILVAFVFLYHSSLALDVITHTETILC